MFLCFLLPVLLLCVLRPVGHALAKLLRRWHTAFDIPGTRLCRLNLRQPPMTAEPIPDRVPCFNQPEAGCFSSAGWRNA